MNTKDLENYKELLGSNVKVLCETGKCKKTHYGTLRRVGFRHVSIVKESGNIYNLRTETILGIEEIVTAK